MQDFGTQSSEPMRADITGVGIFVTLLLMLLWLLAGSAMGQGVIQPLVTKPTQMQAQEIPLRIVSKDVFCSTLQGLFVAYGAQQGFNKHQSALMASNATSGLLEAFRAGRAADFIDQKVLTAMLQGKAEEPATPGYLPLATFVAPAMGVSPQTALIALSAAELRFIPFAQKGVDIVVIAQSAAPLTPERARTVAQVAQSLQIKLNVIWVGGSSAQKSEAQAMAFLAAVTGGGFVDLSGGASCSSVL